MSPVSSVHDNMEIVPVEYSVSWYISFTKSLGLDTLHPLRILRMYWFGRYHIRLWYNTVGVCYGAILLDDLPGGSGLSRSNISYDEGAEGMRPQVRQPVSYLNSLQLNHIRLAAPPVFLFIHAPLFVPEYF